METTADLILKNHFRQLKAAINKQMIDEEGHDEARLLLKEVFNYFDYKEREGSIDKEGSQIYLKIATFLDASTEPKFMPEKKPMEKAGKSRNENQERKTGT